jgi:cytochrome c peroxidase
LTNGTVPPHFEKSESEVLGVPDKSKKLDADLGKFELTKAEIHRHSFKTPTIRNIALTAPYMHNGVYKTLEEVVDFYNDGGGNGLGFKLPNQTLPEDKLNLTAAEKKQLIAFMKTLTDEKY